MSVVKLLFLVMAYLFLFFWYMSAIVNLPLGPFMFFLMLWSLGTGYLAYKAIIK